jgi:hypothetical protein
LLKADKPNLIKAMMLIGSILKKSQGNKKDKRKKLSLHRNERNITFWKIKNVGNILTIVIERARRLRP